MRAMNFPHNSGGRRHSCKRPSVSDRRKPPFYCRSAVRCMAFLRAPFFEINTCRLKQEPEAACFLIEPAACLNRRQIKADDKLSGRGSKLYVALMISSVYLCKGDCKRLRKHRACVDVAIAGGGKKPCICFLLLSRSLVVSV